MKKVEKTLWAVLGALVGLAAAPTLFLWTFGRVVGLMLSIKEGTHIIFVITPLLGVIVLGIALSFFMLVRWKHANIGLKVGLTIVIWTLVVAVLFSAVISCVASARP